MQIQVPQGWNAPCRGKERRKFKTLSQGQPLSPELEREENNVNTSESSLNPEAPKFTIHDLPRATPSSVTLCSSCLCNYIYLSTGYK